MLFETPTPLEEASPPLGEAPPPPEEETPPLEPALFEPLESPLKFEELSELESSLEFEELPEPKPAREFNSAQSFINFSLVSLSLSSKGFFQSLSLESNTGTGGNNLPIGLIVNPSVNNLYFFSNLSSSSLSYTTGSAVAAFSSALAAFSSALAAFASAFCALFISLSILLASAASFATFPIEKRSIVPHHSSESGLSGLSGLSELSELLELDLFFKE
jgi:hypothetical protein